MRTRSIISILVTIVACSLGLQVYSAINAEVVTHLIYRKETAVNVSKCEPSQKVNWFKVYITVDTIGIYLPMLIVMVTHFIMFLVLREQAIRRRYTTNSEASNQLQSISRKFVVIVCAFFICLLPKTILSNYDAYNVMKGWHTSPEHTVKRMIQFTTPLLNLNSCINPLIYAKIHTKVLPSLRLAVERFSAAIRDVGSWLICNKQDRNGNEDTETNDGTMQPREIRSETKITASTPAVIGSKLSEKI